MYKKGPRSIPKIYFFLVSKNTYLNRYNNLNMKTLKINGELLEILKNIFIFV